MGGLASLWGDRPAINAKDTSAWRRLFGPRDVKGVAETPGGRVIELKDEPAAEVPSAQRYLSAGCKDEKEARKSIRELRLLVAPIWATRPMATSHSGRTFCPARSCGVRAALAAAALPVEVNPVRTAKPFEGGRFLSRQPGKQAIAGYPASWTWTCWAWPGGGLEPGENGIEVDAPEHPDGAARVFVRKAVGPASVEEFASPR